jgi:hypothetical protein
LKVRIVGGKGGFGATLRSQKPKHPMTNNYDACRDLSGRRVRHVNQRQQLEEWEKKQAEEEKKIEEELKNYKEKEAQMKAAIHANTYKIDERYKAQLDLSATNISNGILLGKNKIKRKQKGLMKLKEDILFHEQNFVGNTLRGDIIKAKLDNFDEDLLFQTGNRKLKRVKLGENEEKLIKDDVQQEPSLMIKKRSPNTEVKTEEIFQKDANLDEILISPKSAQKDLTWVEQKDTTLPAFEKCDSVDPCQEILDTLCKAESIEDLKRFYSSEVIKEKLAILG